MAICNSFAYDIRNKVARTCTAFLPVSFAAMVQQWLDTMINTTTVQIYMILGQTTLLLGPSVKPGYEDAEKRIAGRGWEENGWISSHNISIEDQSID